MKIHCEQGNSYKNHHLTGAGLQWQRFSTVVMIVQADLEFKEPGVLHLNPKPAIKGLCSAVSQ